MLTIERTFVIRAPVTAVFDYLADFSHAEQWDPNTISCTRLDGGALAAGSRFLSISSIHGRQIQLTYEIETFDAPSRLTFVGNNRQVTATDDVRMSPADGQDGSAGSDTEMRFAARLRLHGAATVATPFVRRVFVGIVDDTVAQLKDVLGRLPR